MIVQEVYDHILGPIAVVIGRISCVPVGPRGKGLTNEGDPLIGSGMDARKVPIEFAKGYTKGVSDQVKRTYWAQQEAQKTMEEDIQGRIRYYNATIPERQDANGVIRVQREVIIPIVE